MNLTTVSQPCSSWYGMLYTLRERQVFKNRCKRFPRKSGRKRVATLQYPLILKCEAYCSFSANIFFSRTRDRPANILQLFLAKVLVALAWHL